MEKLLALHLEINDWDAATQDRLKEISGEVASGSVNADYIMATGTWLEQHAGPAAKAALWEIVKTIAAEATINGVKGFFGH